MRRRKESVEPDALAEPAAFLPLPNLPYLILLVLSEGPRHGWGIVTRVEAFSGRRARPSSGSLYLAIARLGERGLIATAPAALADQARDALRTYALSDLGRRVLALETRRLAALVRAANRSLRLLPANWLGDGRQP
jgi:PadR family transcriptional regulator PadR